MQSRVHPRGRHEPISRYTLIQQQEKMRKLLNLPWDACVHSARHTALTNLGLTGVDVFTLRKAAGHASPTTTDKYIHPTPLATQEAFRKKALAERRNRGSVRKQPATVVTTPAPRELAAEAVSGG
ncbi:MAG: tyrosine-type recombinase/integrase [Terriglobales bacterium]